MKYCTNCGSPLNENQDICLNCGVMIERDKTEQVEDNGSVGFAILSFFIPIVGLILFLSWKDSRPKTAKQAGIWAIVGFILNILAYTNIF